MKKRHDAGFTLVEMITVIAIIATMIAFSVPNLRDGRIRQEIKKEARQFGADMAYAQSQTMAQNVSNETDAVHGVGIYIDASNPQQNTYTIFQDMDDNGKYDPASVIAGGEADKSLKKVYLENGVQIKNISFGNQLQTQIKQLSITFNAVPGARAVGSPFCSLALSNDCEAITYFQLGSGTFPDKYYVTLNPSGLIQKP